MTRIGSRRDIVTPIFFTLAATLIVVPAALAETVILTPSKDNTLYEDVAGALSNGAGDYFFAGTTAVNLRRRGLIAFDIAGAVPPGALIDSVQLTLNMSRTLSGAVPVSLHRALADWGESTSDASGEEGTGAPAAPGDATWLHTFFDTDFWALPGGDFAATPSATRSVGDLGLYTWGSTPGMVADVQAWLDDPASNHGWLLLGDESTGASAKRFDSRTNPDPNFQPRLVVGFTLPTVAIPTLSTWSLALLALLLLAVGVWTLRTYPKRGTPL